MKGPAIEPHGNERRMWAWLFATLAVILGLASLTAGRFDGRALGSILFAAAAALLFWEDAR